MSGRYGVPPGGAPISQRSAHGNPSDPCPGIPGLPRIHGDTLKLIAMVTMLIDHAAVIVIGQLLFGHPHNGTFDLLLPADRLSVLQIVYQVMRMIGRLSFPIFAFLLVEGFLHTHSVRNYGLRLLLLSCLSEIPFDLAVFGTPFYPAYQNICFTLALGLAAMACAKRFFQNPVGLLLSVGVCSAAAELAGTDYGAFGVFFVVLLYLTHQNIRWQTLLGVISLLWEHTAPLAFLPIRMYDGTRKPSKQKYLFYAFYPIHLLILWAIAQLIQTLHL
ncbi:MAG: conjugal transfer protein TraX [Clostridiales bacterium]|nr:conjugal transfer protein TraX [Clostridiales bacterium]